MTFTINSKQLLAALTLTAKGINQNNIVPATSCYRLHKVGDKLQVETCNLEISMQTSVTCEIADNLDILIPADKITTLLSSLPDQPLLFTINESEITIKTASGQYTLSGYSAQDYPVIQIETNHEMIIAAEDLTEAIYATAYARSKEASLLKFNGLSIVADKDKLQFAGCNLMVLSVFNLKGKFKPAKILLPVSITDAIAVLDMAGDCKVSYSINSICFEYENLIVKSLLMDEKYPDYLSIIPKNEIKVSLNRIEFTSAIKRVLQFANKGKKITIDSNSLLAISALDTTYKQSAKEQLTMAEPNIINISVNGEFLSTALSRFSSDLIDIWWSAPDKAILICEPDDEVNFAMIMAMVEDGI